MRPNRNKAFSLVEMMMSIGIMAFVFGFMGFLVFLTTRNMLNIHEQILSQSSAGMACQHLTSLMTNAIRFEKVDAADPDSTLTRILYAVPSQANPALSTTGTICWDPANRLLLLFEDQDDVTFSSTPDRYVHNAPVYMPAPANSGVTPTKQWRHIADFFLSMQSHSRLDVTLFYTYHGFAFRLSAPMNQQLGEYQTTLLAKNHYTAQPGGALDEYPYGNNFEVDTTSPLGLFK